MVGILSRSIFITIVVLNQLIIFPGVIARKVIANCNVFFPVEMFIICEDVAPLCSTAYLLAVLVEMYITMPSFSF